MVGTYSIRGKERDKRDIYCCVIQRYSRDNRSFRGTQQHTWLSLSDIWPALIVKKAKALFLETTVDETLNKRSAYKVGCISVYCSVVNKIIQGVDTSHQIGTSKGGSTSILCWLLHHRLLKSIAKI